MRELRAASHGCPTRHRSRRWNDDDHRDPRRFHFGGRSGSLSDPRRAATTARSAGSLHQPTRAAWPLSCGAGPAACGKRPASSSLVAGHRGRGRRLGPQGAKRDPEMQIAVMQPDVAALIANGQPLTLFGDALFLELDLSTANLPAGSRLRVGAALLEVTPAPHNGCRKFQARFGAEALRFVSQPAVAASQSARDLHAGRRTGRRPAGRSGRGAGTRVSGMAQAVRRLNCAARSRTRSCCGMGRHADSGVRACSERP